MQATSVDQVHKKRTQNRMHKTPETLLSTALPNYHRDAAISGNEFNVVKIKGKLKTDS